MKENNSATHRVSGTLRPSSGVALAGLGVLAFSFSFPATSWTLRGFGPWTATGLRGVIAGVLAVAGLLIFRAPMPKRTDWAALTVVAGGCALGFPLLTTLALQTSSTAHSAVVIGALPMVTASIASWRARKQLATVFWGAAAVGGVAVIGFTLLQSHGRFGLADAYLLGALLVCAAGYAEGGRLSGHMAGWRVIAWGVLIALPVNVVVTGWGLRHEEMHLGGTAIGGLVYVAAVSQFLGFVVWYRGMGLIGVARASQLQLAQPLLTLVWAALFMGEKVPASAVVTAVVVVACIVVTQRAREKSAD